jgi:uncharacterized protein (TIGR02594 family)
MSDHSWLAEARKHIGQREIAGTRHNPLILRWWTAIRAPFTDDETPWCAAYVGGVLEAVGIRSSRSAMARSYMRWGVNVAPAVGAIVVFSRPPRLTSGHVGFVVGRDQHGRLMVLGGNQGDAVNIRAFSLDRVLGYRWPDDHPSRLPGPGTVNRLPIVRSDGTVSTNEA